MALSKSRLKGVLKAAIEANIRSTVLSGDATAYPQLTAWSDAMAQSISDAIVDEFVNNGVISVDVGGVNVNPGTFTVGATPVTGVGTTQSTTKTGGIT
jgi:hypothetical protein